MSPSLTHDPRSPPISRPRSFVPSRDENHTLGAHDATRLNGLLGREWIGRFATDGPVKQTFPPVVAFGSTRAKLGVERPERRSQKQTFIVAPCQQLRSRWRSRYRVRCPDNGHIEPTCSTLECSISSYSDRIPNRLYGRSLIRLMIVNVRGELFR
jgi:hypothetical protein